MNATHFLSGFGYLDQNKCKGLKKLILIVLVQALQGSASVSGDIVFGVFSRFSLTGFSRVDDVFILSSTSITKNGLTSSSEIHKIICKIMICVLTVSNIHSNTCHQKSISQINLGHI